MSEKLNVFNEDFLKTRLNKNKADNDLKVVDVNRSEVQVTKTVENVKFIINRGHAYKDHATGPATNARFGGPPDSVEAALIKDTLWRFREGHLSKPGKIAHFGTGIIFRHIPIRYNAIVTKENPATIVISDYMVWQGTVNVPKTFTSLEGGEQVTRQFPDTSEPPKTWETALPTDNNWRSYD